MKALGEDGLSGPWGGHMPSTVNLSFTLVPFFCKSHPGHSSNGS